MQAAVKRILRKIDIHFIIISIIVNMFSFIIPKKKSKSVYGVLGQMYFYIRTMGLFQFSANLKEIPDHQIYLTNMDWLMVVVQLTTTLIFTVLSMTWVNYNQPGRNSMLSLGSRILMRAGMTSNCAFIIFNVFNRQKIWSIFQRMDEFDVEIKSMGTTINYSRHEMYTGIFVKVQIFVSILFIALSAYSCRNFIDIMFVLGFLLPYVTVNAVFGALLGLFTFLLMNIKLRFKKLNENLCSISPMNGNIKIINTSQDDTVLHIMRMSQLHDKLNDIIETSNFCYSFQVMGNVGGTFAFSVISFYSLYKAWSSSNTDVSMEMAVVHSICCIYYNLYIVVMLWAGSTMRNEGQRTALLLHNFINNCDNSDIVDRLMLFSQQLKHRIPEASCKLFPFDWTLLFSIVGATASYLTILIQFDSTSLITISKNETIIQNVSMFN